jgi:hypothetical protein
MSGLDPSGPSQPTQQTGLNQPGNPASKTDAENKTAQTSDNAPTIDRRTEHDVPSTHNEDARPSALGAGDSGPLKVNDVSKSDQHPYGKNPELEGEQMAVLGEGEVAQAVRSGGGGGHKGEADLLENIDQKAKDHEAELKRRGERTGKEIEAEESEDWTGKKADIGEALGGRGAAVVLAPEGAS